jgi:hypothetical protein
MILFIFFLIVGIVLLGLYLFANDTFFKLFPFFESDSPSSTSSSTPGPPANLQLEDEIPVAGKSQQSSTQSPFLIGDNYNKIFSQI